MAVIFRWAPYQHTVLGVTASPPAHHPLLEPRLASKQATPRCRNVLHSRGQFFYMAFTDVDLASAISSPPSHVHYCCHGCWGRCLCSLTSLQRRAVLVLFWNLATPEVRLRALGEMIRMVRDAMAAEAGATASASDSKEAAEPVAAFEIGVELTPLPFESFDSVTIPGAQSSCQNQWGTFQLRCSPSVLLRWLV